VLFPTQRQITHVLLTRPPLTSPPKERSPSDLHVLGTPPALILSQDQTLSHSSWLIELDFTASSVDRRSSVGLRAASGPLDPSTSRLSIDVGHALSSFQTSPSVRFRLRVTPQAKGDITPIKISVKNFFRDFSVADAQAASSTTTRLLGRLTSAPVRGIFCRSTDTNHPRR
jgi:hypothetical protein